MISFSLRMSHLHRFIWWAIFERVPHPNFWVVSTRFYSNCVVFQSQQLSSRHESSKINFILRFWAQKKIFTVTLSQRDYFFLQDVYKQRVWSETWIGIWMIDRQTGIYLHVSNARRCRKIRNINIFEIVAPARWHAVEGAAVRGSQWF